MSLLVIGTVAYDSVKTPSGSVEESLGGSATYFSFSSNHFKKTELIAAIGEDFKLMVDANHAYNTSDALYVGRGLDDLKILKKKIFIYLKNTE